MEDRQLPRKIAVVGATGRVGRPVVAVLTERGHEVVPIARSAGLIEAGSDAGAATDAGSDAATDAGSSTRSATDAGSSVGSGAGTGPETARIIEVAGPQEESMAARLAARCGYPAKVDGVSDPADPGYEINENGGLLPGPGAILAGPTFDEWLSQQYPG